MYYHKQAYPHWHTGYLLHKLKRKRDKLDGDKFFEQMQGIRSSAKPLI